MSWFEKCEEHLIDGRHIYVCSKKPEYIKLYAPWIIKFCSSRKVAKFFPTLWFSLEEAPMKKVPLAYSFVSESAAGLSKIYLIPSKIPDFKAFDNYLLHELTHLWHNHLSRWAERYAKSSALLTQAIEKLLINELQKPGLPELRDLLSWFVWELHSEGIAQYVESSAKGQIKFAETSFIDFYQKGGQVALNLNQQLLRLSNGIYKQELKLKLTTCFRGPQYSIGSHMVFSLLYLDPNLNLAKLAKMNHFTFIKKYEACMLKRGLKPVVSLTSGAGDFDYKRSLQQWWKAVKG